MNIDKLIDVVPVLLPIFGGLAFSLSGRGRARKRIDEYLELAERVDGHLPATAERLRGLAAESAEKLMERDRHALKRRLDGSSIGALVVLWVPAIYVFVIAWGWDGSARVIGIVGSILWVLLWTAVGGGDVYGVPKDDD